MGLICWLSLLKEMGLKVSRYQFGDLHALMDSEKYFAGEKLYAFGFGEIGFFGGSGWDYVWADNATQAAQKIRQYYPLGVLSIRLAVYGETDCDNFDLSGHLPH